MKVTRTEVLVTGAGPVGLTTALFLHEQGMDTKVVDAKPHAVTHSYALALHPASLDLLEAAGVLGDILAHALPVRAISVHANGRCIATLPIAPAGAKHPFLAVTGQDVLESALGEALARRRVPVLWNHRLARFQQDAGGVRADVDELEERVIGYAAARFDWLVGRTNRIEARFLVGADGHGSLVRRQQDIDFREIAPAEHFAVFEFQAREPLAEEVVLVLHDDGIGVLWPLPGGRARWSFAVDSSRTREAVREKDHEPVQLVGPGAYPVLEENFFKQLLAERAPWFEAGWERVYWRMLVRFERRLAARFGDGRVWLAGDAGHLTGPAGIQSMNVGLREARDLARFLVRSGDPRGSLHELRSYDEERQAEWKTLLGVSGGIEARPGVATEIARNKDALISCLPASGEALRAMAAELGLQFAS
jgi:2-polyprenyl-6-methoxyphenol hydroxylase-like FAD-dependent oxidoreductase